MAKKNNLSFRQQLHLLIVLFILLIGSISAAFYFFGFSIGLPTTILTLVLFMLITKRYIDTSDEHYLAPIDRKMNFKKLPWLLYFPLFIFIVITDIQLFKENILLGVILGLFRATLVAVIPLVIYYRKMKKLGYHLEDGKWDKEGVETEA
ncbi:hypothetical protein [Alkalihalobacillus sp. R86527]|uniref:hypothetical protein n=1 Tax=Alkalihalobacillus sp. R86527 TaxID=3093863 RepID=UPI00366B0FE0